VPRLFVVYLKCESTSSTGAAASVALGMPDLTIDLLLEAPPVEQPRERVVSAMYRSLCSNSGGR